MVKNLPDWLIVCLWRALLGEIYSAMRAIAVSLSENRVLMIRCYLDRHPSKMDYESMEVVATNISASTGLDLIARIDINCQYASASLGAVDCLDGFIYCRREYDIKEIT